MNLPNPDTSQNCHCQHTALPNTRNEPLNGKGERGKKCQAIWNDWIGDGGGCEGAAAKNP